MNALAQIIGSILMYGVGKLKQPDIESWRILFLICGALTTVSGVLFFFAMPSTPDKAWFLTKREKQIVKDRMERDRKGGDKARLSLPQIKETVFDLKSWFILIFGVLSTLTSPVIIVWHPSVHINKSVH